MENSALDLHEEDKNQGAQYPGRSIFPASSFSPWKGGKR